MTRMFTAAAALVLGFFLVPPMPAQAVDASGRCHWRVIDPVTHDGYLSAGPIIGHIGAATTKLRCTARLGGPDGPVVPNQDYVSEMEGPVGVMLPLYILRWGDTQGDIWFCTSVATYPQPPQWTYVDKGCLYAFTH